MLSIDADERVTPALRGQIESVLADPKFDAYSVNRSSSYCGQFMRHSGWSPDRIVRLFRRGSARFSDDLVHEALQVRGPVGRLDGELLHESFADFEAVLASDPGHVQAHYNRGQLALLEGDYAHGWADYAWRARAPDRRALLAQLAAAVRPGGTLLVLEPKGHVPAADFDQTIVDTEAAGFRLVASGDFLRNPNDPRDPYRPVNYDGRFHGPVTVRTALSICSGASWTVPEGASARASIRPDVTRLSMNCTLSATDFFCSVSACAGVSLPACVSARARPDIGVPEAVFGITAAICARG